MRTKIKDMKWFALISILFIGIVMTLPAMNIAYGIDYVDMPEIVVLTIVMVVIYVAYLGRALTFRKGK